MLGLFKRILSRPAAPAAVPPPQPVRAPAPRAATPPPALPRPVPRAPVRVTPIGGNTQPAATPAAPVRTVEPPPATSTHVQVSVAAIAAGLPEAISHKVPANPDQFVAVPIDKILPQLAYGQVVFTAAELRECAPDYFSALTGNEDVSITLPLGDIVKQLTPAHFARRQQTRIEIPKEVGPVFTPGSNGSVKPAAPQAAPVYRAQPTTTTTTPPAPQVASAPGRISMSPQALAALGSNNAAAAPTVRAQNPIPTPVPSTVSNPAPRATVPALPKKNPAPAKVTGELAIPLSTVCAGWVQEVRAELTDVDIEQAQIFAPLELLEPAMKSGKVLFSWEEVASWLKPPLLSPPTRKVGEMTVDLPLKVLAPLFMAHHRGTIQKRVAVDETIPDLFAGGTGAGSTESQIVTTPRAPVAPAPVQATPSRNTTPVRLETPAPRVVAPATPTPIPTPTPTPTPAPVSTAPAVQEIPLEKIVGNGTGRYNAKQIVANAASLPNVMGALLVMSDGLLVTSQMPPTVKGETIAAFLPQMFGRMNQYTKELVLGPLQQLTLGVEGGQWHVIKCDNIYFAVLGRHGDALPLNLLAQIAAELSSQSK